MTTAFATAGVAQVYLERKIGMSFMEAQMAIEVHFWVLIASATLFTIGIIYYVINFFQHGMPTDEALVEKID